VADEENALLAKLIGDGDDIGDKRGERVGSHAARFAAFVVATLVGNDDAEASGSQGRNLFVPPIPEFREAMQEKNNRPIGRTGGDSMKLDGTISEDDFFERRGHAGRVYLRNAFKRSRRRTTCGQRTGAERC